MSEYWKSTPKYWCKFCKIYVRDTTLEKKQHEQTGKHQSAIQKSLRELHKTQSREERDKQRDKDEVKRVTGAVEGKPMVAGSSSSAAGGKSAGAVAAPVLFSVAKPRPTFTREHKVATAEDRRKQAEQLASLGVRVPDEFRGDMAVPGEWSTVEVREVYRVPVGGMKEEGEDGEEGKEHGKDGLAQGVKRRREEDGDEDEDGEANSVGSRRKVWGSTLKSYPGTKSGEGVDFDALLSNAIAKKEVKAEVKEVKAEVKEVKAEVKEVKAEVKEEEEEEESTEDGSITKDAKEVAMLSTDQKQTEPATDAPIVFKKRKGKR